MKRVENVEQKPEVKFDLQKFLIRSAVDNVYGIQKLRIATGNRVCAAFKQADAVEVDGTIIEDKTNFEEADDKMIKRLTTEYERITDLYAELSTKAKLKKAVKDGVELKFITTPFKYDLVSNYIDLLKLEKDAFKTLETAVKEHPMWDLFFKNVIGCGPAIAGTCIAYLDVHQARHVSSFWSYAGVGTRVNENGERVAMSKKTTVMAEYVDKEGNVQTKKSIGYNPELHTKLLSLFVSGTLKAYGITKDKDAAVYAKCYYDYKNRYENRADLSEASAMRIHRMAARQCVKAFLRDLWVTWRTYECYEISQPYEVEYLGRAPHKYNEYHERKATI